MTRDETESGELLEADTTGAIIRLLYRVYDRLGFGFVESVYANAFAIELRRGGISFRREVRIRV